MQNIWHLSTRLSISVWRQQHLIRQRSSSPQNRHLSYFATQQKHRIWEHSGHPTHWKSPFTRPAVVSLVCLVTLQQRHWNMYDFSSNSALTQQSLVTQKSSSPHHAQVFIPISKQQHRITIHAKPSPHSASSLFPLTSCTGASPQSGVVEFRYRERWAEKKYRKRNVPWLYQPHPPLPHPP